jgi:hypothetical protein
MNRVYIFLILSVLCGFGCSKRRDVFPLTSIRPVVIEAKSALIAYHGGEIKKYQQAVVKEETNIIRLLNEHKMREVRRAYNRKMLYNRKIKEHKEAMVKIEGERE